MRQCILILCLSPALYSLPMHPKIVSGSIEEASLAELVCADRTVLQWQDFCIDAGESLRFTLPSKDAAVLNQVASLAQIDGSLFSNGQVYFSAPNGVVIGKDAVIDVGALLISTLPIDQNAFIRG